MYEAKSVESDFQIQ